MKRRGMGMLASLLAMGTLMIFAAFLVPNPAEAVTVTVLVHSYPSVPEHVQYPDYNGSAGEFQLTINPGDPDAYDTIAYCFEIGQSVGFNTNYTYDMEPLSNDNLLAAQIMDRWAPGLGYTAYQGFYTENEARAAVQLAVWEVTFEDPSNGYSVNSGDFQAISGNTNAQTLANIYLALLLPAGNYTLQHSFAELLSDNHQDLLVATPIPGAVWLLGSGLIGLLSFRRRRRA